MLRANRKQAGFTLIELMITLVIAVIIAMVAVPSFTNAIQRNRIAANTNMLVSFLATARSEAVKLGKPVSVCASSNGTACTGGSFADGWIIFIDTGTAGTVDGTDRVLNVQGKLGGGINVTFNPPGGKNYIQFTSNGMLSSSCEQCAFDPGFPALVDSAQSTDLVDSLIEALLPWGTAHASGGSGSSGGSSPGTGTGSPPSGSSGSSGSSGTSGGSGSGAVAPGLIYTYVLCDPKKKVTGQSVSVYGSGRVSSKPYNLQCPPP